MKPVRIVCFGCKVDVQPPGEIGSLTKVGFQRIFVLDQMVNGFPRPNDIAQIVSEGFDFNNVSAPNRFSRVLLLPASRDPFVTAIRFPKKGQHIAIGKDGKVVVLTDRVVGEQHGPFQIAFPVVTLNDAAFAPRRKDRVVGASRPNHVAIRQEVGHHSCLVVAGPALYFFTAVVDEEGGVGRRHRQEGETIVRGL